MNSLIPLILISFLDHQSFQVRQSAESSLSQMGMIPVFQLMLLDKDPSSVEASVRIKRLLSYQNSNIVDCMCLGLPPYIDAIPYQGLGAVCPEVTSRDTVCFYYMMALRDKECLDKEKTKYSPKEEYWGYRLAGRRFLEDLRTMGISDREVMDIIRLLKHRSEWYLEHNKMWPEYTQ